MEPLPILISGSQSFTQYYAPIVEGFERSVETTSWLTGHGLLATVRIPCIVLYEVYNGHELPTLNELRGNPNFPGFIFMVTKDFTGDFFELEQRVQKEFKGALLAFSDPSRMLSEAILKLDKAYRATPT